MIKPLRRLLVGLTMPLCLAGQTPNSADRIIPASAPTPRYGHMTEKDRLKELLKQAVSPAAIVSSAAGAGLGQWRDRPYEWKQGAAGYSRRYVSSFGEHMVQETVMFGVANALREDNRYVPSREFGVKTRVLYAVRSTFLARGEDGSRYVSLSRMSAFTAGALLSRTWQPPSSRSLGSAGVNFAASVGVAIGWNVVREFWPHK